MHCRTSINVGIGENVKVARVAMQGQGSMGMSRGKMWGVWMSRGKKQLNNWEDFRRSNEGMIDEQSDRVPTKKVVSSAVANEQRHGPTDRRNYLVYERICYTDETTERRKDRKAKPPTVETTDQRNNRPTTGRIDGRTDRSTAMHQSSIVKFNAGCRSRVSRFLLPPFTACRPVCLKELVYKQTGSHVSDDLSSDIWHLQPSFLFSTI